MSLSRITAVAVLVIATLALAGCGRRGPPELATTQEPVVANGGIASGVTPLVTPDPVEPKPKRAFLLDPLL